MALLVISRSRGAGNQQKGHLMETLDVSYLFSACFYTCSCAVWLPGRGAGGRVDLEKPLKFIGFCGGISMCAFLRAASKTRQSLPKSNENRTKNEKRTHEQHTKDRRREDTSNHTPIHCGARAVFFFLGVVSYYLILVVLAGQVFSSVAAYYFLSRPVADQIFSASLPNMSCLPRCLRLPSTFGMAAKYFLSRHFRHASIFGVVAKYFLSRRPVSYTHLTLPTNREV